MRNNPSECHKMWRALPLESYDTRVAPFEVTEAVLHARLGHIGRRSIDKLCKAIVQMKVRERDKCKCEICIQGKMRSKPMRKKAKRKESRAGDKVYADLKALDEVDIEGNQYILYMIDERRD